VALPPFCQAHDLHGSVGDDESSIGFQGFDVLIRNVGGKPCRMAARIRGITSNGVALATIPVASDHGGSQVLPPNGAARFSLGSERLYPKGDPCNQVQPPGARHPRTLMVVLPQGGAVSIRMPTVRPYTLDCVPLSVSRLFRA
jgi:hypothetical protein